MSLEIAAIAVVGIIFCQFILKRINRFIANLFTGIIGLVLIGASSAVIFKAVGFMIFIGGIMLLYNDFFSEQTNNM